MEVDRAWLGMGVVLEVSLEGVEVGDVFGTVENCPWVAG